MLYMSIENVPLIGGMILHNITIKKHNLTKKRRHEIAAAIKSITKEAALKDFQKIRRQCKTVKKICDAAKLGRAGNDAVDYFTFPERLETVGNKGISFYDFYHNRRAFSQKPYIKKYTTYAKKLNLSPEKLWFRMFQLYFGSVNIFRPLIAANLYKKYKPRSILDPTMGWGGRAIAAAALDIPHYIGIDLNKSLRAPYKELSKVIAPHTTTKLTFMFQDALTVDYSKLDYDMVMTSPPYYSVEIYKHMKNYPTKEEWNAAFYRPLIEKTYKHLAAGGVYILNVPVEVYEENCVPLLGAAKERISLPKSSRGIGSGAEKEYIYVWNRGTHSSP